MLIRDQFKKQVKKTPDGAALVYKDKETTWREIDSLSNRFAQGILNLGFRKGDRLAGILNSPVEFLVTYMALAKCGIVFVPLNYQSKGPHFEYMLNHSESRGVVCDAQFFPVVKEIRSRLKFATHMIVVGGENPEDGTLSFNEVLSRGKDEEPSISLKEEEDAIFLYTAGTTGDPKGVVHTHFNVAFVAPHWAKVFRMEPGKSILMGAPLFHAFGLHCMAIPALVSGARLIMTDRYHTQWALESVPKYRITVLPLVPAMGTLIINHPDLPKYDFSSVEIILIGGAIVPYELFKQWRKAFPKPHIINGFGQTESCPCATGLWDVDILEKPGSVGKPWEVVSLKIVDDQGKEVPPGQAGEIVYKVASIMKGYYKEPKLTAETIREGWLYSGDLGHVDEDGYVYIMDRKKDIIIRGGENISTMEIEEVIYKIPGVLEASVIGAPHSLLGETVMAVVVRKPGPEVSAEEIIKFCQEHLEHYKVPARIEFINGLLPRNPGGKVLKRELKKTYFGDDRAK
jgi:long-chain acyl-CoA synthetase